MSWISAGCVSRGRDVCSWQGAAFDRSSLAALLTVRRVRANYWKPALALMLMGNQVHSAATSDGIACSFEAA